MRASGGGSGRWFAGAPWPPFPCPSPTRRGNTQPCACRRARPTLSLHSGGLRRCVRVVSDPRPARSSPQRVRPSVLHVRVSSSVARALSLPAHSCLVCSARPTALLPSLHPRTAGPVPLSPHPATIMSSDAVPASGALLVGLVFAVWLSSSVVHFASSYLRRTVDPWQWRVAVRLPCPPPAPVPLRADYVSHRRSSSSPPCRLRTPAYCAMRCTST